MSVNISLEPHQPSLPTQFWCNDCDCVLVDSTDLLTGLFFVIFGHAWSSQSQHFDGEYKGVMFAICKDCLKTKESEQ
jgi:hypothetical protein